MQDQLTTARTRESSLIATHAVLRNTYMLLSLTLLFSAAMAAFSTLSGARPLNFIVLIVGMYGLMFLTQYLRNSAWGIASIFAFTGFMGYTLGPILNSILHGFTNGSQIIMTAFGATGIIFLALSAYTLTTRKDFSYMSGFLFAGIMIAFIASIANIFFQMPLLQLMVSCAFALLSSGMILWQTSNIIHGGERNYIMATITLFVSLFNLFISLLQIFTSLSGRD